MAPWALIPVAPFMIMLPVGLRRHLVDFPTIRQQKTGWRTDIAALHHGSLTASGRGLDHPYRTVPLLRQRHVDAAAVVLPSGRDAGIDCRAGDGGEVTF